MGSNAHWLSLLWFVHACSSLLSLVLCISFSLAALRIVIHDYSAAIIFCRLQHRLGEWLEDPMTCWKFDPVHSTLYKKQTGAWYRVANIPRTASRQMILHFKGLIRTGTPPSPSLVAMVTVSGNDRSGYTYHLRDHALIHPQPAKGTESFQEFVKSQDSGLWLKAVMVGIIYRN